MPLFKGLYLQHKHRNKSHAENAMLHISYFK